MRVTIALDAMGGDGAPAERVAGALLAARECDVLVRLVGAPDVLADALAAALSSHGVAPDGSSGAPLVELVAASDVVLMDEAPSAALRHKPDTSIAVACAEVTHGRAEAVVSAGHTGATLMAAHAAFGLLPGVHRPALAVAIPTETGSAVLIDVGAGVDCRAEHLVQFGVMGSAYARVALGRERPAVGLLSIGEEPGKGTRVQRDAASALERAPLHFIGNVEARALFTGVADVIVCDGFTGNVVLKTGEGLAALFERRLRSDLRDPASVAALDRFARRVDDEQRGAAPLVGVARLVMVAHGRSSARAIRNAIDEAARLVRAGFVPHIAAAIAG